MLLNDRSTAHSLDRIKTLFEKLERNRSTRQSGPFRTCLSTRQISDERTTCSFVSTRNQEVSHFSLHPLRAFIDVVLSLQREESL